MSKKAPVPLRIAPLQFVIGEPITDPAEIAAMERACKRKKRRKNGAVPLRIAPLQFVVGEPITDPAEIAAVDEMRKRLKNKKGGKNTKTKRKEV
jgi:hypothetical protein